jgi:hypothetical protein
MKIQFKPFRIYVEKYHIEDGNIYPPRILNLKRVGLLLLIIIGIVVALSSCNHPESKPPFITKRVVVLENNTVSFIHVPKGLDSVYRYEDTVWVNLLTHRIDDSDSLTMMCVIKK